MNIEIPAIPVGVLALLQFFAPFAIAIAQNPRWSTSRKKAVAIILSVVLTIVVLVISVLGFGLPVTNWWTFGILGIVVSQASYALITGTAARSLSQNVGLGKG